MALDIGLLLLRLLLGFVLFAHATQKLAGWFNGPGPDRAAAVFEGLGHRPGRPMALLAGSCELAAAVLLAAGFATPLGAAIATGTMLVAGAAMTGKAGSFWAAAGGGEYPFVLAVLAAALAFTGPGNWSLDILVAPPWASPSGIGETAIGAVAALVAVLAALPPTLRAARTRRTSVDGARSGTRD